MRLAHLVIVSFLIASSVTFTASSHEMPYGKSRPGNGGGDVFEFTVGFDQGCGIGNHLLLNITLGGVCFGATADQGWGNGNEGFTDTFGNPAGSALSRHLTAAGPAQTTTLVIIDALADNVAAAYCQNLNPEYDNLCGANLTGPPQTESPAFSEICQAPIHVEGTPWCPYRSEPYVMFCGSITIRGGLTGPLPEGSRLKRNSLGDIVDWGNSVNWAIDFPVFVFLRSSVGGNFPESECGGATQGTVSHT